MRFFNVLKKHRNRVVTNRVFFPALLLFLATILTLLISAPHLAHADDPQLPGDINGDGVLVEMRSSQIYVENNILRNLRHHLVTQAGCSYVVFGYNFLVDTVRDECIENNPAYCSEKLQIEDGDVNGLNARRDSDVCLHGNYPHSALFEGNVFYWIWIDPTHGANGPYNMLFRNKAHGQPNPYGYWMEGVGVSISDSSPGQTVIGNLLLNDSVLNYYQDSVADNLLIGANVLSGVVEWGDIPEGTVFPGSLYRNGRPDFWTNDLAWPPFGPEASGENNKLPAEIRYLNSL